MDGQEVEIRVEAGKNGVLLTILDEIGGCWSEEMWTVNSVKLRVAL